MTTTTTTTGVGLSTDAGQSPPLPLENHDNDLIEQAWCIRDEKPELSNTLLDQESEKTSEDSVHHGYIATVRGYHDIRVGRYDHALRQGFLALELFVGQKQLLWESRACSNIAIGCHETGNLVSALKYFHRQLTAALSLPDEQGHESCFSAHHNIARHYMLRDDFIEANKQFDLAEAYVQGKPAREAYLAFNRADCLSKNGQNKEAEEMVQNSLFVASQHNLGRAAVKATIVMAELAQQRGQIDRAIVCYLDAINTAQQNQLPAIRASLRLAELYLNYGKKQEARKSLQHTEAKFQDTVEHQDRELFLQLKYRELEVNGEFELALVHYKTYSDFRESRSRQEADVRLAATQETSRIEALQRQSELLKKKNSELQKNLKKLSQLHANVKKQSVTDELTGLYNRRYFFDTARTVLEHSREQNQPVSIAVIDVDNFKSINDNYGHARGDMVLGSIAVIMSESLRKPDVIARYGGEEFVLLLPDTPVMQGSNACERLRVAIERFNWQGVLSGHLVTVSIGVAQAAYTDSVDDLLLVADEELYRAKKAGRNQVCFRSMDSVPIYDSD